MVLSLYQCRQANPGVVTMLEHKMHGFETGETVSFKELSGMDGMNGSLRQIEGARTLTGISFSFPFCIVLFYILKCFIGKYFKNENVKQ